MGLSLSTRAVRPEDEALLAEIYGSTRPELALLGWPGREAVEIVRMQLEARARHFAAEYPGAEDSVILLEGRPAGRLTVERTMQRVHVLDIALLPAYQRAGAGTALVHRLADEASSRGVPVTCHVAVGNPALAFWERLGFVTAERSQTDCLLQLAPRPRGVA
ncbi:MAG TPA: GNAT family N-acetyltransferase [Acidimicrobiales bacterium]|nr:GNAT family N-acetyltransferase [Acidimicrobiales bacterium]